MVKQKLKKLSLSLLAELANIQKILLTWDVDNYDHNQAIAIFHNITSIKQQYTVLSAIIINTKLQDIEQQLEHIDKELEKKVSREQPSLLPALHKKTKLTAEYQLYLKSIKQLHEALKADLELWETLNDVNHRLLGQMLKLFGMLDSKPLSNLNDPQKVEHLARASSQAIMLLHSFYKICSNQETCHHSLEKQLAMSYKLFQKYYVPMIDLSHISEDDDPEDKNYETGVAVLFNAREHYGPREISDLHEKFCQEIRAIFQKFELLIKKEYNLEEEGI